MAEIRVLPKSVAELIAAGEVVERPASVVKELTENAVDAGATQITVEIKKGGVQYIRVTDNGCGIAASDVTTAFLPHATSKIQNAEDLGRIFTLGFRGEALASIAAVAKVYLLTRPAAAENGVAYTIEGGQEISNDPAGCPVGTTMIVRELFYNTPARLKFLKKDVTEGNFVADAVTKTALSHPEIRFTFIRDEKRVFSTPGGGDLYAAVYAVFGKETAEMLLPCAYEYGNIRISGFISKPSGNRPNRSMQYFFVNGRYVRIPAAAPALDRAYKNSIMIGKFPMCFLSISLPAEQTDVNVHPAKTEIRFSEESKIFEAVFYAARSAISRGDTHRPEVRLEGKRSILEETSPFAASRIRSDPPAPALFEQNTKPPEKIAPPQPAAEVPARTETVPQRPGRESAPGVYQKNPGIDIKYSEPVLPKGVLPLHDDSLKQPPVFAGEKETFSPEAPVLPPEPPAALRDFAEEFAALGAKDRREKTDFYENVRVIGEAFRTYIIAESGNKLLLIDKHAAHERMIFNSLADPAGPPDAQLLLSPVTVSLSGREYAAVMENLELLAQSGYEIEDFGGSSVIVRACPVLLTDSDIAGIVRELAGKLLSGDRRPVPEKLDWIRNSTACRAAVKAGDALKPAEMQHFVETLLSDAAVRYCPHGRPVLYELTKSELEKQFGRQQ